MKNSDEIPPTERTAVKEFSHEEMKYKNFKHEPSEHLKISIDSPSILKNFKNITLEKNFVIPQKPTRGLK